MQRFDARGLLVGLGAVALAAFTPAFTCGGGGGGPGSNVGPAAVFVIDSTSTLYAFDANGNKVGSTTLPGPVDAQTGGGMAYGPSLVAGGPNGITVTTGGTTGISQYTADAALAPLPIPPNLAFPGAAGITYDPGKSEYFVGDSGGICILGGSPFSLQNPSNPLGAGGCVGSLGVAPVGRVLAYDPGVRGIWTLNRTPVPVDSGSPLGDGSLSLYLYTEGLASFAGNSSAPPARSRGTATRPSPWPPVPGWPPVVGRSSSSAPC